MTARERLLAAAAEGVLIKDGPYGTAVQNARLTAEQYRGECDLADDQKGNNDLVNLTQPQVIAAICNRYIDAGATVLATNTFNANRISQADYGAESYVRDMNMAAAKIIRDCCDAATAIDGKPRFVAGALGPTNKTLSLSPDVNDPGYRGVDWDTMVAVYREQIDALLDGGADYILIETVFDTLNCKAGIMATLDAARDRGEDVPLMISMTLTDLSGRNLSGHTVEAFWWTVRHANPVTIGLNCSFGASQLRPHVKALSAIADTLVMVYPNAGLPNELGEYDEEPEQTANLVREWVEARQVNILGGCCGSTPEHIAAMAALLSGKPGRTPPAGPEAMHLAGLEPMAVA